MMILVDGNVTELIAIADRGLQYGDGLFETLAVIDGQLQFWHKHMQRLEEGCERLAIPMPDSQQLLNEVRQVIDQESPSIVKIIISRGQGGRGYRPPQPCQPSRIISRHVWPDYPADMSVTGVKLRYCDTPLGSSPALAGMKHLNRLEQVLARNEWQSLDIFEGLMLDVNGNIIEGTMSNLFFVDGDGLHTPDLSQSGVKGIMRDQVFAMAEALDIPVQMGHYRKKDLAQASEVFICNSIIGIVSVYQLAEKQYAFGPTTQSLIFKLKQTHLDHHFHETI